MLHCPAPRTNDPDTGPFWQAAARGELALQFCLGCGNVVHLPRPRCPKCGGTQFEWRGLTPRGSVYAWAVVRHQVHPDFPVPHTLVLVELTDCPQARLVGVLDGAPALQAGQPLHATFPTLPTGEAIVAWHLEHTPNQGES
jgi:uncharacterized protein